MNRPAVRGVVAAIALALLLSGLFFACFERTTREEVVGASRAARANPYLALSRTLEGMGREVVLLDGPAGLDPLPPSYGTIFLPTRRTTVSSQRSEELLDWTRAGGHLVVVTWTLWDDPGRRPDPLLDPLDFRQRQVDWPPLDEAENPQGEDEKTSLDEDEVESLDGARDVAPLEDPEDAPWLDWEPPGAAPPDIVAFAWHGAEAPLHVEFDGRYVFDDVQGRAEWRGTGHAGDHLLGTRLGRGMLTALTDDLWLRNDRLGDADHAEMALRLAALDDRPGPAWIVVSETWPGLLAQARRYAAAPLLALLVLIAAWVWRASRRFGPILPPAAPERRRFLEHLDAAGRFHWRQGRGDVLLRASREAVERRMRHRHPGWARLPAPEQVERLASLAELPIARVREALSAEPASPGDAAAFRDTLRTLERIRQAL